ncbi:MAG: dTDP-4-amino-4,6-dideoxygalactose transaminase [Candidatus Methylomirabilia bacterium]
MLPVIPFNRPFLADRVLEYHAEAARNSHISGDGPFTKRCHKLLESSLGVPQALLTTSCTHALEMAALLLGVGPGDEVIAPSYTFVSTVNAFVLRGAKPVFCDIRPDTLNLDENLLERHLSPRTRAIIPVHYAGVGCEMDAILDLGRRHGVPVVEDNAHGIFGKYRDRWLGTLGAFGAHSFHDTKNFTCGEGGALFLNDPQYRERAEIIREKGTDRSRFFRGQVDKYSWVDLGSSYLPSDLLAAFLLAQLEARDEIQGRRRVLWETYSAGLADWAGKQDVRLPFVPGHCLQAYHMFYLLLPSEKARQALIEHARRQGVNCVFHYLPLHLSRMGLSFGGRQGDCPVSESVSERIVRLPFFTGMETGDAERVLETVTSFRA